MENRSLFLSDGKGRSGVGGQTVRGGWFRRNLSNSVEGLETVWSHPELAWTGNKPESAGVTQTSKARRRRLMSLSLQRMPAPHPNPSTCPGPPTDAMHLLSWQPLSQISSSSCYLAHSCHSGVVEQISPTYRSGSGLRKRKLSWGPNREKTGIGQGN